MNTSRISDSSHRVAGRWRQNHGFTLTELVVTVSIAAILLAIGIPSFRSFILGQTVKTASYDLAYSINLARSEAIKRNNDVVITEADGGWQNGWTVATTAGGTTTTLSRQTAYANITVTNAASNLTYNNNGRLSGSTTTAFEISDGTTTRCVKIQLSGLPSTKTGGC